MLTFTAAALLVAINDSWHRT